MSAVLVWDPMRHLLPTKAPGEVGAAEFCYLADRPKLVVEVLGIAGNGVTVQLAGEERPCRVGPAALMVVPA